MLLPLQPKPFHEVRGVEQALIQQIFAAVEEQYLIAMKERSAGLFIGHVQQILEYLLVTYGNFHRANSMSLIRRCQKCIMTYRWSLGCEIFITTTIGTTSKSCSTTVQCTCRLESRSNQVGISQVPSCSCWMSNKVNLYDCHQQW